MDKSQWATIDSFYKVGALAKTHGADGHLKLILDADYLPERGQFLFADIAGSKVPFRVEKLINSKMLRIKFRDINDSTKAKQLVGADLYIPADKAAMEAVDDANDEIDLDALVGFEMIDANHGLVGTIDELQEFPQQMMAIVTQGTTSRLIPINDTFVLSIEFDHRVVNVELPDGLLSLHE